MCPETMNSEALSSRWLPLILLFGAPPPHPGNLPIHNFNDYFYNLITWTNKCRVQYMEWEGIEELEWGDDYNRCKRKAFDTEFINWAYTLKPEEYNEWG